MKSVKSHVQKNLQLPRKTISKPWVGPFSPWFDLNLNLGIIIKRRLHNIAWLNQ